MTKYFNPLTLSGLFAIAALMIVSALVAGSSTTASAGETAGTVPVETETPEPEPTPTPDEAEDADECLINPVLTPTQEQFFFETSAHVEGSGFPCEAPVTITWEGSTDGVAVGGAFAEHQVTSGADGTFADEIFLEVFAVNWTVTATDADGNVLATATFVDPLVGGVIAWEVRSDTAPGPKIAGATFVVDGADGGPGPRYCSGNSNPLTIVDNGLNDVDATAGEFRLNGLCPGVYTVTETIAPLGFAVDPDPDREVEINSSSPTRVIGGGVVNAPDVVDDCAPDSNPSNDNDLTSDFCNPTSATGSLRWEKRNNTGGGLVGTNGATFTVGGTSGPFACRGDSTNPLTVVDGGVNDASTGGGNVGRIQLNNVCPGTYTVTETIAPPGFALDPDNTRSVTVVAGSTVDIGTDGSAQECPDATAEDADTADFCNGIVTTANLRWEKRNNDTGALVPVTGATFTVGGASGPFACRGDMTNPVTVTDGISGINGDNNGGAGTIQMNNICPGTYTVTETVAPVGFGLDPDPDRVVTVASGTVDIGTNGTAQECPDTTTPLTDAENADFCNPTATMRTISWEKRDHNVANGPRISNNPATFTVSGANGGPGPFACRGDLTNPVTVVDDGPLDSNSADGLIVLANVCAEDYIVTETIAPFNYRLEADPTRYVDVTVGNATIGTTDTADSCPDTGDGGVSDTDLDSEDFCNTQILVAPISWEKRDHTVAGGPLLGGAAFTVGGTTGPWACLGNSTNPVIVIDDFSNDSANPAAGQLRLENVCPGTYTVTETTPPTGRSPEPDPTRSVTVNASAVAVVIGTQGTSQSCPDSGNGGVGDTDANTEDFCDPILDADSDGVLDHLDNCPLDANTDQADNDGDDIGDVCDPDDDDDTVLDGVDNCPLDANTDQADNDGDDIGDVCDPDDDDDTVLDGVDNCPLDANTDQADNDGDDIGDVCDPDDDDDTVLDGVDNCPLDANTDQADNDGDDIGDVCDPDDDDDTVLDGVDNCPLDANTDQLDTDGDAEGDACDDDDDGDGVLDGDDECPLDPEDIDGDEDDDGCPETDDSDGDGVLDDDDNCPDDANANQADDDNDGVGNVCDPSTFVGFFSPVDNPGPVLGTVPSDPKVNTGKGGRTYPIKFMLLDEDGNPVGDIDSIVQWGSKQIDCGTVAGDPTDGLEISNTGGTSLRYDSTTGEWIYNWKTPKYNVVKCYVFTLELADGGVYTAYFKLTP